MLTGGVTPILTVDELQALGYKIVVCPIESLLVCGVAIQRLIQNLLAKGRVDLDHESMLTFAQVKEVLGLNDVPRLARATAITNLYEGEAMTRALMLSCCLVALLVGCTATAAAGTEPHAAGRPEGHPDQRAGNQRQR